MAIRTMRSGPPRQRNDFGHRHPDSQFAHAWWTALRPFDRGGQGSAQTSQSQCEKRIGNRRGFPQRTQWQARHSHEWRVLAGFWREKAGAGHVPPLISACAAERRLAMRHPRLGRHIIGSALAAPAAASATKSAASRANVVTPAEGAIIASLDLVRLGRDKIDEAKAANDPAILTTPEARLLFTALANVGLVARDGGLGTAQEHLRPFPKPCQLPRQRNT